MGQVAFFGQNEEVKQGQVSQIYQYPDELNFNLSHIATLISTRRHEETLEIDLLEKWIEFLTHIEPEELLDQTESIELINQAYIDILDTITCLLESDKAYPIKLLNILAQYGIR